MVSLHVGREGAELRSNRLVRGELEHELHLDGAAERQLADADEVEFMFELTANEAVGP